MRLTDLPYFLKAHTLQQHRSELLAVANTVSKHNSIGSSLLASHSLF